MDRKPISQAAKNWKVASKYETIVERMDYELATLVGRRLSREYPKVEFWNTTNEARNGQKMYIRFTPKAHVYKDGQGFVMNPEDKAMVREIKIKAREYMKELKPYMRRNK